VSKNLSTEAENFNVQRGSSASTASPTRWSSRSRAAARSRATAWAVCRAARHLQARPDDFRKHYVGVSDNMFFISTQLKGIKVSEYRTKIILKPQNIVPDLDLVTGEQG
jgi:hypothetical protein